MHATGEFQKGVRVGGATTAVLLAFLYTVAAPTNYFRARIPFLLGSGGVRPFSFTLGVFMCASLIGLLVTGTISRRTIWGAALVALACALAVSSGAAARILPQFPETNLRWAIFVVLAAMALALLVRERMATQKSRINVDPTRTA